MLDRYRSHQREQRVVAATVVAATGAWLALVGLARWSDGASLHGHGTSSGAVAPPIFTGLWLVMVVAMMLPPSSRFVRTVDRLVATRPDRRRVVGVALLGYALVWVVAGQAFQLGDRVVHELVDRWAWLAERPHLVAATTVVLAGAYQFAPLKLRCLRGCRSPSGFVARGWGGRAPLADALRIGASYGWSCVGCCWALMLLMFAAGLSSLALMAVLTAVMVLERQMRRIELAVPALGAALVVVGALMALGVVPVLG